LPDGVVVAVQFIGNDPLNDGFETAQPGPTNHQGVAIGKLRGSDGTLEWHRMIESGTTSQLDGLNLASVVLGGGPDGSVSVGLETRGTPDTVRPFGGTPCAHAPSSTASADGTTSVVLHFDGNGGCVFAAVAPEPAGGALDDNFETALVGLSDRVVLLDKSSGGNRRSVSAQFSASDGTPLQEPAIEDVDIVTGLSAHNDVVTGFVWADSSDDPGLAHAHFAGTDLVPMTARADFFAVSANKNLSAAQVLHHMVMDDGAGLRSASFTSSGASAVVVRSPGPHIDVDGTTSFTVPTGGVNSTMVVLLP
jgi:hypothetical protein